jgi:hypothetical protein
MYCTMCRQRLCNLQHEQGACRQLLPLLCSQERCTAALTGQQGCWPPHAAVDEHNLTSSCAGLLQPGLVVETHETHHLNPCCWMGACAQQQQQYEH